MLKNPKACILGIAFALLALPDSPALAKEKIVANFTSLAEPFFVFMRREIIDEAKQLDVEVAVLDGQSSSPKQTADIENALAQGVDGIILAPNDVKALTPVVNEVLKEKVPIVTVDRRVEGADKPVPHVGADNVAGGRKMAKWVIDNFPNGARIVFLTGQPGSSTGIDRAKGVREGIAAGGEKYKIVAEQTANWSRDQGLSVTQSILTSLTGNPPDVIIASNDDMALGALEAVHTLGLKNVKVIGFDAVPEALRKVKSGELGATVEQNGGQQIRTALRMLVENIRKGAEMKSTNIEPILITPNNLQDAARYSEM